MNNEQRQAIEQAAAEKLERAKLKIIARPSLRFWGDILKREMRPDWSVPTGYTDGAIVGYNPQFVADLTDGQVIFLLVHEVLHIKLLHHLRNVGKDKRTYNMAADYAINLIADREKLELIPDILLDYKYAGWTEAKIYDRLAKDQQQQDQQQQSQQGDGESGQDGAQSQSSDGEGQDQGEGQSSNTGQSDSYPGDIMQPRTPQGFEDLSESEQKQVIDEAEQQVRKDNLAAQAAGNVPAYIKELFDLSAAPALTWKQILADFCLSRTRSEYDWNTTNKHFAHHGIYLPDLGGTRIESVAIAIDVSGSVDREQLTRFLVEMNDIAANCEVSETTVFQVNTEITKVDEYMDGDDINPDVVSGGGTSFVPPFEYIEYYDAQPEFLIYFTDGHCHRFADEPDFPVLWVLNKDNQYFKPPYGEVITMDEAN